MVGVRAICPQKWEEHVFRYVHERVRRWDNVGRGKVEVAFNVWHKSLICLPSNIRDVGIVVGHSGEISVNIHVRLCHTIVVQIVHPVNILFPKFVRNSSEKPYHLGAR
jgi:hypothetical protein